MADKIVGSENDMTRIEEMDMLFRSADFSAESAGLAERLWVKIRSRLTARRQDFVSPAEEFELSEVDLFEVAAAGSPDEQLQKCLDRSQYPTLSGSGV